MITNYFSWSTQCIVVVSRAYKQLSLVCCSFTTNCISIKKQLLLVKRMSCLIFVVLKQYTITGLDWWTGLPSYQNIWVTGCIYWYIECKVRPLPPPTTHTIWPNQTCQFCPAEIMYQRME